MKRTMALLSSIIVTFFILVSFPGCNSSNSDSSQTSSVLTDDVQIATELEKINFELSELYSDGYMSFGYSPNWTDKSSKNRPNWLINNDLELSIYYMTDQNNILSNDDYINSFIPASLNESDYLYINEKGFPFVKEQSSNSIHFRTATTTFVLNISFNNYSSQYEELIFSFLDTIYIKGHIIDSASKQNQYSSFSGNTTHSKQKKVFSGNGDKVTELFTANGCKKITGTYTGEGAFVVMLYDEDAHLEGLIFSNSGQYNGEKVFKFIDDKKYMFEISATDGDWTISIE